jgi:hypothetical protein
MRCHHAIATAVLAVLLPSAPAAADYDEVAPIRPLTMSDPAGLTVVGVDLQYTTWTEHPPTGDVDISTLALDLHGDIRVAPHWVILARLPLSHATVEGDPALTDCCDFALGNFTLGGRGLWASLFGDGSRAVAGGELSLSLPTANDSGASGVSAGQAAVASLPHDPGRYAPNTTTIRLTGMSQYYSRWFLAHAEIGPRLYIYDSDVPDDGSDFALRLALALGVRATYTISILAELTAQLYFDEAFRGGDETVTSLDVGVRYGSGRGIFGARFYFPLDPELRDVDMLGFGLDAGLRF